jgi:hypothetical protein
VTNNCGAITSSVAVLTVNKQTPLIATAPTAATGITYGQLLSAAGLTGGSVTNAAGAIITGNFAYNTPNVVLNAGTASQGVTFTPDDTNNYFNVSGSVSVTVNQAPLGITANNDSKIYGQTKTYGSGSSAYTITGGTLMNGDAISTVTITDTDGGGATAAAGGAYRLTPSELVFTAGSAANYSISYNTGTLNVGQASTFVGAISTDNPCGYKAAVAFTATLPADATGNVVFSATNGPISTNTLSSGTVTCLSITNLPRGTNVITVAYLGDVNYFGSTNNLNQVVTNHPPVATDATYYRAKNISLKIALTNLLTHVTDVDGDAIALSSVGIGLTNATITTDSFYIYYLPGTGAGSNDNDVVSYTVSDGFGGSATANLLINVYSAAGPAQMSLPTNGVVNITFFGIPNYTYVVQTTTNLSVPWWTLSTNTAGTNGIWQFTDPNATNAQQYYRSSQP